MIDIAFILVILTAAIAVVVWYCVCVHRLDDTWEQCERDLEEGYWSRSEKEEKRGEGT